MNILSILKKPFSRKVRVGLALGSGGVKGFSHIGVIKALEEGGVPIHCIAGSSAGAIVGALYASGNSVAKMEELVAKLTSRIEAVRLFSPSFQGGLADVARVKKFLAPYIGGSRIESLPLKFACIATDLTSGERVVLDRGNILDAIGASMAIPGIFTPTKIGGRVLVDGGVTDPVPITLAREMGAEVVIAVNVATLDDGIAGQEDGSSSVSDQRMSFYNVMLRSFSIYQATLLGLKMSSERPDFLIEPPVAEISLFAFNRGVEVIGMGYRSAFEIMDAIKSRCGA